MPKIAKEYQIILGTFIDNKFVWHDVAAYDNFGDAYREFKKYVNKQLSYTDKELAKVWNCGRLDIELRRQNKLLNWTGIYSREAVAGTDDAKKDTGDKKAALEKEVESKDSAPEEYFVFAGKEYDMAGITEEVRKLVKAEYMRKKKCGEPTQSEVDEYLDWLVENEFVIPKTRVHNAYEPDPDYYETGEIRPAKW